MVDITAQDPETGQDVTFLNVRPGDDKELNRLLRIAGYRLQEWPAEVTTD